MTETIPTLYTIKEVQALLKVTQRTVYRYIESGKLKANKTPSGQWRVPQQSVLEFLGMTDSDSGGQSRTN